MRIPASTAIVAAVLTGCAALSGWSVIMTGVPNPMRPAPMTPEESRSQVLKAAREVVAILGLDVVEASFWHSACNSRGDPPFRGRMRIGYPPAQNPGAADDQIAAMLDLLRTAGWSADSAFLSHAPALKKNDVIIVLRPQDPNAATRGVDVIGECRDVTTTIEDRGPVQSVILD